MKTRVISHPFWKLGKDAFLLMSVLMVLGRSNNTSRAPLAIDPQVHALIDLFIQEAGAYNIEIDI